jgi:hypothetical protein
MSRAKILISSKCISHRANLELFAKLADGEMQIAREPIPPMPGHLKAIIEEMK